MKKFPLLMSLLLTGFLSFGQNRVVDSLYKVFKNEKKDTAKITLLNKISRAYQGSKPDSALLFAQEAYFFARNKKFVKGESWALSQMAVAFNSLGNFPKALEYYLDQLKIEEKRGYPQNVASVYLNIALLYNSTKDFDKAILYAKTADSIINANKFEELSLYSLLNIGEIYEKNNKLDSALHYTQICYAKAVKAGSGLIKGTALNNLGNVYYKSGNLAESFSNYKAGLPYLEASNDYINYAEGMLGLAKIFNLKQQPDSAILYSKAAYNIAAGNQFLAKALDASFFLSGQYKVTNRIDSAFAYQEIMNGLKDSIDSREKIKALQNITIEEQLRQNEIARLKKKEKKENSQKLQLLLIGLAIPISFFISVIISRKKVHKKLIEFSGIFSILLLFEYITLLLHPFIAEKSNHSPFIEIVIFVAIAAIITPSHHKIEHWLIGKLTEFNYLRHTKPAPPAPAENINEEEITT